MSAARGILHWLALGAAGVGASGCILISSTTTIQPLPRDASPEPRATMRAHMLNGDVVTFARAVVTANAVVGGGVRLSAVRRDRRTVDSIPLDSVVGLETFVRTVNQGRSVLYAPATLAVSSGVAYFALISALGGPDLCSSGCSLAQMPRAQRLAR